MSVTTLFESGSHKNVLVHGLEDGAMVPANQHLIVDKGKGIILDPGGHKIYNRVLSEVTSQLGAGGALEYVFLSHQDPDIVAAVNGWLMTTDANAYASKLWLRFIPHFGLDSLVTDRLHGIGDEGMALDLGDAKLKLIPAHFLHSCGNFQLYDPVAKILYTGDLGASVGADYVEVPDINAHFKEMETFHKRYMAGNRVMRAWAGMARSLDIEIIAPQHGAFIKGREAVGAFIDWCEQLQCGIDLLEPAFPVPAG